MVDRLGYHQTFQGKLRGSVRGMYRDGLCVFPMGSSQIESDILVQHTRRVTTSAVATSRPR